MKVEETVFRVKGTGLDTTNLDYSPKNASELDFQYYYTNPNANNGPLIYPLVSNLEKGLIVGIDFLDEAKIAILEHLYELRRVNIDLLLIDASCNFEDENSLNDILELKNNCIGNIGIKNPEKISLERLMEVSKLLGGVKHIALNLSPLYFNKEILDWAYNNEVEVIAFNPLGGHLTAPCMIDSFGLQYLLNFSGVYADTVILSGKDLASTEINSSYLNNLVGESVLKPEIYTMKRSVDKLVKPLRKICSQSLVTETSEILPMEEAQNELFDPNELILSIGEEVVDVNLDYTLPEDEQKEDLAFNDILQYLENIKIPSDTENDNDIVSVVRPKAFALFRARYLESAGWECFSINLGNIVVFNARKVLRHRRYLFAEDNIEYKTVSYLLYYKKPYGFILRNLKKFSDAD